MDEAMLDGNAVAGLLQDVFAVETTTAIATCAGCGAPSPMGATQVYRGAGFVLRCPHCEQAMVTLVPAEGRLWIGFPGIRTLQVPVDGA
ncbi:DUF6510 family protein [Geodermatophilus sp. SYSU D00758]